IWWRRSWLSLNSTIGIQGQDRAKGALSYATQLLSTSRLIPAPRCRTLDPCTTLRWGLFGAAYSGLQKACMVCALFVCCRQHRIISYLQPCPTRSSDGVRAHIRRVLLQTAAVTAPLTIGSTAPLGTRLWPVRRVRAPDQ